MTETFASCIPTSIIIQERFLLLLNTQYLLIMLLFLFNRKAKSTGQADVFRERQCMNFLLNLFFKHNQKASFQIKWGRVGGVTDMVRLVPHYVEKMLLCCFMITLPTGVADVR
ncbi:hypothetical protein BDC45DRAFT_531586 [Circinella umbellata]|nr:hypothetical protein BDC45DRAFT_531586 [Circinella umbellata]